MKKINKFTLSALILLSSLIILNIISLTLTLFSSLSYLESARIVFGSVYVLFLPGFIISFIFFPFNKTNKNKINNKNNQEESNSIDLIERIALSFALSISIVPLAVFYLNLVGVRINALNVFFIILTIIIVSLLTILIKDFLNYKKNIFNKN